MLFWIGSKMTQEAPECPQDPPKSASRGPKERPRRHQEDPKRAQELVKRAQDSHDRPKRRQKNTTPKTIVHISVADVAEIDKDKTLLTRGAVKKGRAGGGVPPWGRQSAARSVAEEQGVLDRKQNLYILKP